MQRALGNGEKDKTPLPHLWPALLQTSCCSAFAQITTDPSFFPAGRVWRGGSLRTHCWLSRLPLSVAAVLAAGRLFLVPPTWVAPDAPNILPKLSLLSPQTAFLDFTSDGEALSDVLLGEAPSHRFFPRAPGKAWDVVPSIGMMMSDEGGSETESLYEIEGMNKWILYL